MNDIGDSQREFADVILDTHCEAMESACSQVLVDGQHHGRGKFLAGQTITTTNDIQVATVFEGSHYVQIQGFADRSRFFGAIKHGDAFHAGGNCSTESFHVKGTIDANLYQAELHTPFSIQIFDGFLNGLASATHGNDDVFGIRIAHIIKEFVAAADLCAHFIHGFLDDGRSFTVMQIAGFTALEIDVRSLLPHLHPGCVRSKGTLAEIFDQLVINQFRHGVVIHHVDLLQFVRSAEAVKEQQDGDGSLQSGNLAYDGQIHHFLDAVAGHHGKTSVAGTHHVRMIAKNREGLRRQRTGGYVKHCGEHLAGNLVHIWQHQHQALRSSEGGGESTGRQ
ncbi:hypothetical protein DSECCO2_538770 [anaerobic digester metagenome]